MIKQSKYLIVGGGMTAAAAVEGIRQVDPTGPITLISDEQDPPYNRPPLSKGLWKGKALDTIWRDTPSRGVDLVLGRRASAVAPARKRVTDDQGGEYGYERLLLATGGTPRRFAFGGAGILYYRTLPDYRRLRELAETRRHFAVIGGGFIGTEVAAALAMNGQRVTLIFPEADIGARIFPRDLAAYLTRYYEAQGVRILAGLGVVEAQVATAGYQLHLEDGRTIAADGIVAGLGIEPGIGLAASAGLTVANGLVVNEYLETTQLDIFAAGDVANCHCPTLGVRRRVEHEDNDQMGAAAGRNMAGAQQAYDHLPYFYSDLFELGYEAIGETDPRYNVVAHWTTPYRQGVLFYLKAGRVRGIVFWNVWNGVAAGRALLAQPGPFDAAALKSWMNEALRSK